MDELNHVHHCKDNDIIDAYYYNDGEIFKCKILRWPEKLDEEEFLNLNGFYSFPCITLCNDEEFEVKVFPRDLSKVSWEQMPYNFLLSQWDNNTGDYVLFKSRFDLNKFLASLSNIIMVKQVNNLCSQLAKINEKIDEMVLNMDSISSSISELSYNIDGISSAINELCEALP